MKKPPRQSTQSSSNTCRQCGSIWPHCTKPCPAKGQSCNKCGKPNHFAKMCRTKVITQTRSTQRSTQEGVKQVSCELPAAEPESSSDNEYLNALNHRSSIPQVTVHINEISVDMIVDTGASIDILDDTYTRVNHNNTFTLQLSTKRLFALVMCNTYRNIVILLVYRDTIQPCSCIDIFISSSLYNLTIKAVSLPVL